MGCWKKFSGIYSIIMFDRAISTERGSYLFFAIEKSWVRNEMLGQGEILCVFCSVLNLIHAWIFYNYQHV